MYSRGPFNPFWVGNPTAGMGRSRMSNDESFGDGNNYNSYGGYSAGGQSNYGDPSAGGYPGGYSSSRLSGGYSGNFGGAGLPYGGNAGNPYGSGSATPYANSSSTVYGYADGSGVPMGSVGGNVYENGSYGGQNAQGGGNYSLNGLQ